METPKQVIKMDPKEIPIMGCQPAKNMKISCIQTNGDQNHDGDMIVFFVYGLSKDAEKGSKWEIPKNVIPSEYHQILQKAVDNQAYKASSGSTLCLYTPEGCAAKQICLVGLGAIEDFDLKTCIKSSTTLAKCLLESKNVKTCGVVFPIPHMNDGVACDDEKKECPYMKAKNMTSSSILQNFVQTLLVELAPDHRFKGKKDDCKKSCLESLTIYGKCQNDKCDEVIKVARAFAEGIHFTKELVNAPANYCNPITLANAAQQMAQENGMTAKILKTEEIEDLNMGSYLAVSKGSFYPPRFIHITYKGEGDIKKKIAYVGKGVCFDSGGYNIKSAASLIELMKFDMGGAGACLGAALAISKIKPKNVEMHFIIPAGENMVDKEAYRPGDIITASNGKTIEVGNTDAEGRLMLADALIYADKLQCDLIIDIATLTGACVVALGNDIAGLFSDSDCIAEKIIYTAKKAGEQMWRLPLEKSYRPMMDSSLADINNTGGKGKGGAIMAAIFLKEFVEKTKWAHLDIAGPAWDNATGVATGYGVKTLTQLAIEASECEKCCQ